MTASGGSAVQRRDTAQRRQRAAEVAAEAPPSLRWLVVLIAAVLTPLWFLADLLDAVLKALSRALRALARGIAAALRALGRLLGAIGRPVAAVVARVLGLVGRAVGRAGRWLLRWVLRPVYMAVVFLVGLVWMPVAYLSAAVSALLDVTLVALVRALLPTLRRLGRGLQRLGRWSRTGLRRLAYWLWARVLRPIRDLLKAAARLAASWIAALWRGIARLGALLAAGTRAVGRAARDVLAPPLRLLARVLVGAGRLARRWAGALWAAVRWVLTPVRALWRDVVRPSLRSAREAVREVRRSIRASLVGR